PGIVPRNISMDDGMSDTFPRAAFASGVAPEKPSTMPSPLIRPLIQIFPNLVTTRVCYCKLNIPTRGNVHIALFDQEMKAIITLLNLTLPEGHHTLKLNLPEDLSGSMHFIRVRAPGTDKTEKIRIHAF
ncbi:MAG: hypothetical protein R6T99_07720, partial [Bacteroidales bacterium]